MIAKDLNDKTITSTTMDLNQDLANWKFARWAESICILSPAEQDGSRDVTWYWLRTVTNVFFYIRTLHNGHDLQFKF